MAACASGLVLLLIFFGPPMLIWAIFAVRETRRWNEKFPPIPDDEFMARSSCANPQVALKVRMILADCFNVEYERIYPSSTIQGDLGAE